MIKRQDMLTVDTDHCIGKLFTCSEAVRSTGADHSAFPCVRASAYFIVFTCNEAVRSTGADHSVSSVRRASVVRPRTSSLVSSVSV